MNATPFECFTARNPENRLQVPVIKRRRSTRDWLLFISEGSDSPYHDWDHVYRLHYYGRFKLWVVTYSDVDRHAAREWAPQIASWCNAGPHAKVEVIATALLLAWRDACQRHGGPGIDFYHDYGDLALPYEAFCRAEHSPWPESLVKAAKKLGARKDSK